TQLGIRRKSRVIFLNRRVRQHKIRGSHFGIVHFHAVSKYFFYAFFANSFSKVNKITRITRKSVLKENPSTKILHVGIHYPSRSEGFISQIIKVFQKQTTYHKANRVAWIAGFSIKRSKFF